MRDGNPPTTADPNRLTEAWAGEVLHCSVHVAGVLVAEGGFYPSPVPALACRNLFVIPVSAPTFSNSAPASNILLFC